ncbi:MAG: hypothetical protein ABIK09_14745 [Pseudomonadota bacterium]
MTDAGAEGLYTWDLWTLGREETGGWVVLALTDSGPGLEDRLAAGTHHDEARLSAWRTRDFRGFELVSDDALRARPDGPDSGGIWSGSVAPVWYLDPEEDAVRVGRVLFYTSRDIRGGMRPREAEQRIHCAVAPGHQPLGKESWRRVERFALAADAGPWQRGTDPGESTTGAWRDPHLFRLGSRLYMAVSAKDPEAPPDRRGCVALLRCHGPDLTRWEPVGTVRPPAGAACVEMEVPHVGQDLDGRVWLTYSTGGASGGGEVADASPPGQLHAVELFLTAAGVETGEHRVLLGESSSLYAGWVAPTGDLVGFRRDGGGFANAGPSALVLRENRDLLEVDGLRPRWILGF